MKRKLLLIMGVLALLSAQLAFADPGNGGSKKPTYTTMNDPQLPCSTC